MSRTFSLYCEETGKSIWVGQGRTSNEMTTFYSSEQDTMVRLGRFLKDHIGKTIVLVDDEHLPACDDYWPKDDDE